jgi:small subunit ribosomal protein S8
MQDPIADLLIRLKNGHMAKKYVVSVPHSKVKQAIVEVLCSEGYIESYRVTDRGNNKSELEVVLKYYQNKPVISQIYRVSKPSLRVYKGKDELPRVLGGLGLAVVSTSKGIMSGHQAKQERLGGEVLCCVE